jgi:4-amino-4-deoxy-L-arabinose transferase-like glycosyltransferase
MPKKKQAPRSPSGSPEFAWLPAFLLAAVALALRFYGIDWGLPDKTHFYTYHPDEFLTVGSVFRVLSNKTFDPGFYNYPSLCVYVSAALAGILRLVMPSTGTPGLYLAARAASALMGAGSVMAVYWAGKRAFGEGVGFVSALIICFAPIHVQHSHFATVDVSCTLFVALALGFALRAGSGGRMWDFVLCGVMSGLAGATKYNAGLVVLALPAAYIVLDRKARPSWLWPVIGVAGAAVASVIAMPSMVLRFPEVVGALRYEAAHTSTGHGLVFLGTGNGFLYTLRSSLWYGFGPVVILAILGVLAGLWYRDKRIIILLAFAVPYIALISVSQVRFARYALPVFPALVLITGWRIVGVWTLLTERRRVAVRVAFVGVVALVGIVQVVWSLVLVSQFTGVDPRDSALKWIRATVPAGESIAVIDIPWFYSPPFSPEIGGTLAHRERGMAKSPNPLLILIRMLPPKVPIYGFACVSSFEIEDALRLQAIGVDGGNEARRVLEAYGLVARWYTPSMVFQRGSRRRIHALGLSGLPHDMRYTSPIITIYGPPK